MIDFLLLERELVTLFRKCTIILGFYPYTPNCNFELFCLPREEQFCSKARTIHFFLADKIFGSGRTNKKVAYLPQQRKHCVETVTVIKSLCVSVIITMKGLSFPGTISLKKNCLFINECLFPFRNDD